MDTLGGETLVHFLEFVVRWLKKFSLLNYSFKEDNFEVKYFKTEVIHSG